MENQKNASVSATGIKLDADVLQRLKKETHYSKQTLSQIVNDKLREALFEKHQEAKGYCANCGCFVKGANLLRQKPKQPKEKAPALQEGKASLFSRIFG